jgi:hypothetical protein
MKSSSARRIRQALPALRLASLALATWLLGACGSSSSDPAKTRSATPTPAPASMTQRLMEDGGFQRDEEGNWNPQSNRRSSFEGKRETTHFQARQDKKSYQAGDFKKSAFWGKTEYPGKTYDGQTDGSRFATRSREQGKTPRENATRAQIPGSYQTDQIPTTAARETRTDAVRSGESLYVESNRGGVEDPVVIDWREQRALNVEQTKGILGRPSGN